VTSVVPPDKLPQGLSKRLVLRYFDEILPIEQQAINERREKEKRERPEIGPPRPLPYRSESERHVDRSPTRPGNPPNNLNDVRLGGLLPPELERTRPRPQPCDATGLALSGGGIRSAAFCLGALQALEVHRMIRGIDYLSTVSGGGYIGASMTAAMSMTGTFPFQRRDDPRDTPSVGYIRNYSNYLMPRERSGMRNVAEALVILLRGILANAVLVLTVLLGMAWLTIVAYPTHVTLTHGSFLPRLLDAPLRWIGSGNAEVFNSVGAVPLRWTLCAVILLAVLLIFWVLRRSTVAGLLTSDEAGPLLWCAVLFLGLSVTLALLDLQPLLIEGLDALYDKGSGLPSRATSVDAILTAATAFLVAVAGFGRKLGSFLKTSQHAADWGTLALRIGAAGLVWFASLILFVILYVLYLHLCAWGIEDMSHVPRPFEMSAWSTKDLPTWLRSVASPAWYYFDAFLLLCIIGSFFKPNSYSLHRLYRDRLSKAFLSFVSPPPPQTAAPQPGDLKLSGIDTTKSPYHILNAAMNVQGSLAANQRGREADFFIFSHHFIGSDLTLYGRTNEKLVSGHIDTSDMERIDPAIDLAAAMAISGAAISANMGSNTIRPLSPTLALLNIRLGYWLRNPRDLARQRNMPLKIGDVIHRMLNKFYLLTEMLNLLNEKSRSVYLTDGGHIENLGVYELLKRGCQLIIVIDAECDPTLSFPSLVKMERYARIDLGARIDLPWKEIARASQYIDSFPPPHGPHCALGRIIYHDGSEGILFYVKSSLTGDETDYVLDYKKRNPTFPHETTGDQFFSEEQFEVYRALGFHAVDRALSRQDSIALPEAMLRSGPPHSDPGAHCWMTTNQVVDWMKAMVS
jgi:hypothetical protein